MSLLGSLPQCDSYILDMMNIVAANKQRTLSQIGLVLSIHSGSLSLIVRLLLNLNLVGPSGDRGDGIQ